MASRPNDWVLVGLYEARLIRDAGYPTDPLLDPSLDQFHQAGACFTEPRIAAMLPLVTKQARSVAILMLARALSDPSLYDGLISAMNLADEGLVPVINLLYTATFDPAQGGTPNPLAHLREIEGNQP